MLSHDEIKDLQFCLDIYTEAFKKAYGSKKLPYRYCEAGFFIELKHFKVTYDAPFILFNGCLIGQINSAGDRILPLDARECIGDRTDAMRKFIAFIQTLGLFPDVIE